MDRRFTHMSALLSRAEVIAKEEGITELQAYYKLKSLEAIRRNAR